VTGPLRGIRIIEFAGIGPGPYGAMLLGDLGAEIIRIERPPAGAAAPPALPHPTLRGRRSICIDLSLPAGVDAALELVAGADALIEGYRPGKMEKLGLGPNICLERNPQLVYGRMTGWGQTGPNASAVGHDINYIALSGVLGLIGRRDAPPTIPLNLVGDYGGGGAFLALGLVAALLHARSSGTGQVVDVAMIDGAASLLTSFHYMRAMGRWDDERGTNHLDSGAPYYDVYETADGKWVSIGAIEPAFYARLLGKLGLSGALWQDQQDRALWPQRRQRLVELFRSRTRTHWCELLDKADVCFAPVLAMDELVDHPHHRARDAFIVRDGVIHPAPAPRFSVTESRLGARAPEPGADTRALLAEIGFSEARIADLLATGVVRGLPADIF
jgi:alpha-methylacyl-CoA racemase